MDRLQFSINQIDASKVTSRTRDGREYLIAPVVMLCEGVLNGELLTAEEFEHHAGAWNGRPIVLGHPLVDGLPVSANDPDLLAQFSIGHVFDAMPGEGKLRAQAWVDVDKAAQTPEGREVVQRLRTGQGIEVSTAYWRDLEEEPGELAGAEYVGIARNLKPDHLAFLLHDVGACSIDDGCGCPRVNQEGEVEENVNSQVDRDLETDQERGWIKALTNSIVSAVRTLFVEANMDERRQAILDSASMWDTETLEALTEEQVTWLHGHVVQVAPEPEPETNETDPKPEPAEAPDVKALLDEYLADLGGLSGLKAKLAELQANEAQERAELVTRLKANQQCILSEEQLGELGIEVLQGIEQSLIPADYRGQGGGLRPNADEPKVEKLAKPRLFEEVA
jgi:hypothetical protein